LNITLRLPPDVEAALIAEAHAKRVPLDELVSQMLIAKQPSSQTVFEQGLGLFGSPEDAALLDEVVAIAYAERRRPPKTAL
jgi:hypothetical protein